MPATLLRGVVNASLDGVMALSGVRDAAGVITDFTIRLVNPAVAAITGAPGATLEGGSLREQLPGNVASGLFARYVAVVESGVAERFEQHYDDGAVDGWFRFSVAPFEDGVVVSVSDISEQRRATEAALRSEARFRALVDCAPDGVVAIDCRGIITTINAAAAAMFGMSAPDMAGQPLGRLMPPRFRDKHEELVERFFKRPDGTHTMSDWRLIRGMRQDGEEFPILVSIAKTSVFGEPVVMAVVRDMSEVEQQERTLVGLAQRYDDARRAAEAANRAKSNFLAEMSHDLRTPLNAIIGFAESLQLGVGGALVTERQKDYVGLIYRSGGELLDLVENLLDFSRLEAGERILNVSRYDPVEEMTEAMRALLDEAASARITLKMEPVLGPKRVVSGDRRAFRRIAVNLLSNGLKYVPAGGRVSVAFTFASPAEWRLTVLDDGPGLPAAVLDRMGEGFIGIADDSYVAVGAGAGLGLAICKSLVEAHGGHFHVDKTADRGACIAITMPDAVAGGASFAAE